MAGTPYSGPSTKATGAITTSVASLLSFPTNQGKGYVIVSNTGANIAYFKINDPGLTVSASNYDFALFGTGSAAMPQEVIEGTVRVDTISVLTANVAGAGISVVGW